MEEGVEIACLCESHLTINSPDITNDRYDIIRQDRPTHLGGLLTFIDKSINYEEINCGTTLLLEYTAIRVFLNPPSLY